MRRDVRTTAEWVDELVNEVDRWPLRRLRWSFKTGTFKTPNVLRA